MVIGDYVLTMHTGAKHDVGGSEGVPDPGSDDAWEEIPVDGVPDGETACKHPKEFCDRNG